MGRCCTLFCDLKVFIAVFQGKIYTTQMALSGESFSTVLANGIIKKLIAFILHDILKGLKERQVQF
jgi:hypothetical protein